MSDRTTPPMVWSDAVGWLPSSPSRALELEAENERLLEVSETASPDTVQARNVTGSWKTSGAG